MTSVPQEITKWLPGFVEIAFMMVAVGYYLHSLFTVRSSAEDSRTAPAKYRVLLLAAVTALTALGIHHVLEVAFQKYSTSSPDLRVLDGSYSGQIGDQPEHAIRMSFISVNDSSVMGFYYYPLWGQNAIPLTGTAHWDQQARAFKVSLTAKMPAPSDSIIEVFTGFGRGNDGVLNIAGILSTSDHKNISFYLTKESQY